MITLSSPLVTVILLSLKIIFCDIEIDGVMDEVALACGNS